MNKYIVGLFAGVLLFASGAVPAQAAALTTVQANSLIAVVQSAPGVPASAFVNLITAFSNITINQATSLITVIQSAPGVPASAFVNLLISFTVDTATTQVTAPATTQTVTPTTSQSTPSAPTISSVSPSATMISGTLTIRGKNLTSGGNPSVQIYSWGGSLVATIPFVSLSSISNESIVLSLANSGINSNGTYQIKVMTPVGGSNAVSVYVQTAKPTATLSASPALIFPGQSSTLSFSSANAAICSTHDFTIANGQTSGTNTVSPTQTTTYTIDCFERDMPGNYGAYGSASVTITVTTP